MWNIGPEYPAPGEIAIRAWWCLRFPFPGTWNVSGPSVGTLFYLLVDPSLSVKITPVMLRKPFVSDSLSNSFNERYVLAAS